METTEAIAARLRQRQATVGIVGLGYVGLPLMLAATAAGFTALGFDVDAARVNELNEGRSPLQHIAAARVGEARATGRFEATTDLDRLGKPDALLICVPTPLGRHREPDLSFVEATVREIARRLRPGQLIVLESTTWPGTTREVVRPILETSGLVSGEDFHLAFSPEREDPGNAKFSTAGIPKVVGGDTPGALTLACALYDQLVVRTVPVSSTATAEAVKLTENIFRSVNIALVNELKVIFSAMGIDVFEVIDAAKTKPFGYMPFYPGPGLGGHCIPIDPFYLTWKAEEFGLRTRFIELAGEISRAMPGRVVEKLASALDMTQRKGLNGSEILLVGVAYKKNVDDVRESPALVIFELLEQRGAVVSFVDPHIDVIPHTHEHPRLAGRARVDDPVAAAATADAVLIVTDHDRVDYPALARNAKLVVDTRNVVARVPPELRDRFTAA